MLRGKVGGRSGRSATVTAPGLSTEALPPGCVRGYVFPPIGLGVALAAIRPRPPNAWPDTRCYRCADQRASQR